MELLMLLLALTCTIVGVVIGDCAKWMNNSSNLHKLAALAAGFALFAVGIAMFAHCFGML